MASIPQARIQITADGTYELQYHGGQIFASIQGTALAGTYTVQVSQDGVIWQDSDLVLDTTNLSDKFSLGSDHQIQLSVTGFGGTDVYFSLDTVNRSRVV